MNKKFITVGTTTINDSYFSPIIIANNSVKPHGGIWLTECTDDINENPWLNFISIRDKRLFREKFSDKACVVTLKDSANILYINSQKEMEEIIEKYPSIFNGKADFIDLSSLYDGAFINYSYNNWGYDYYDFAIPSLVLFNTGCIDYYQRAKIGLNDNGIYKVFDILVDDKKEKVIPMTEDTKRKYEMLVNEFNMLYPFDGDIHEYFYILPKKLNMFWNSKNINDDNLNLNVFEHLVIRERLLENKSNYKKK